MMRRSLPFFGILQLILALVMSSWANTLYQNFSQFETQSDTRMRANLTYMDIKTPSVLYCAAKCDLDKRCMSASFYRKDATCYFTVYRTNGTENQQNLVNQALWTALTKTDYLSDWKLIGKDYYLIVEERKTYIEAWAYCKQEGGQLAEPQTQQTNNLIRSYISAKGNNTHWFGLTDEIREGRFVWNSTGVEPVYSAWRSGEPNNYSNREDCALYDHSGRWADSSCNVESGSICGLA